MPSIGFKLGQLEASPRLLETKSGNPLAGERKGFRAERPDEQAEDAGEADDPGFHKNLTAKGGAAGRRHESSPAQNQNDNVLLTLHVRSGGMRNVPHEPSGLDAIGINSSLASRFRTLSETTQFTALPMIFSFRR